MLLDQEMAVITHPGSFMYMIFHLARDMQAEPCYASYIVSNWIRVYIKIATRKEIFS